MRRSHRPCSGSGWPSWPSPSCLPRYGVDGEWPNGVDGMHLAMERLSSSRSRTSTPGETVKRRAWLLRAQIARRTGPPVEFIEGESRPPVASPLPGGDPWRRSRQARDSDGGASRLVPVLLQHPRKKGTIQRKVPSKTLCRSVRQNAPRAQLPMRPPSFFVIITVAERGRRPAP